jgi:hypothetical protein
MRRVSADLRLCRWLLMINSEGEWTPGGLAADSATIGTSSSRGRERSFEPQAFDQMTEALGPTPSSEG